MIDIDVALPPAVWREPRRVDVWWWMDYEITDGISEVTGEPIMVRYGTVSWNADGTGHYGVSVSFEREGWGFNCFPNFRALSDAQAFVERLVHSTLDEARALNGKQWPGVVL